MWALLGRIIHTLLGQFVTPRVLAGSLRTRVILSNPDNEILLVKTWLDTQEWELPGGGLHKNEEPEVAAQRELREETGLNVAADSFANHGILTINKKGRQYQAHILTGAVSTSVVKARWPEVIAAEWFNTDNLPNNRKIHVDKALEMLVSDN